MALAFRQVNCAPLAGFDAAAPDGAVIGIIGENGAGKTRLLDCAAGVARPESGKVEASGPARLLGSEDSLDLVPEGTRVLLLNHTLARQDLLARERAAIILAQLRRAGATVLLVSHEEDLSRRLADEVWWLREGKLARRGDPGEVWCAYRRHIADRLRARGGGMSGEISPRMRRGDGRAEIVGIQTTGEDGRPTTVWRSGEEVLVKVHVRFARDVTDPVVGMMIRTRIGLDVYGTNTELENLKLGPVAAGATLEVHFAFRCDLCPQEYTLTAASHDPDGTWHDWLDDAVAFAVTGSRYTAGVANLRARVARH